jgi:hypothetical protein
MLDIVAQKAGTGAAEDSVQCRRKRTSRADTQDTGSGIKSQELRGAAV